MIKGREMRNITDLKEYYTLNVSQLADTTLQCPNCGREHCIPIKMVDSGTDLVKKLPTVINAVHPEVTSHIGVVYDRHIEDKINTLFFEPFDRLRYQSTRLPLGEEGLLLEASTELGDRAAIDMPDNIDFLIGVGSGVICDLTKWIATKHNLPFLLMGTAASMNAYTSITGTMTENNVKSTRWLNPAKAVLMDSALIASAPHEMTCAGVGDLLARQVANADWKLSHIIRDTYFCPVPFQMMATFQEQFLPEIEKLQSKNFDALQKLSDAIMASGYSMTILDGETSPSSGSEHIISHFFDFQHEVFGKPKNLHGAQVGIGTIIMGTAFEVLQEIDPVQLDIDKIERRRLSQTAVQLDNRRIFEDYHGVFNHVVASKRIPDKDFRIYIQKIIDSWEIIWKEIQSFLMPADLIRQAMQATGGHTKLAKVQRTPEDTLQALLYGPRYRPRYTILDLYWELGLFPQYAQIILEKSGVLDEK